MSPITLKLSGKQEDLPFATLDQEELCNTWRVCTRVKDALEEGSRLENLSWRLWFLQNVLGKQQNDSQPAETTLSHFATTPTAAVVNTEPTTKTMTTTVLPSSSLDFENTNTHVEPITSTAPISTTTTANTGANNNRTITENFKMHQFSSDQANDPVIPLVDMFGPEGIQEFLDSISDMTMPSSTTTNTAAPTPISNYLNQSNYLQQPLFDNFNLFDHSFQPIYNNNFSSMSIPTTTSEEYYTDPFLLNYSMISAAASTTAIPNATLHNKLLATLPKQTLASAERLLAPTTVQQQQQQQKCSLPTAIVYQKQSKRQRPDYYYSTFQAQSKENDNSNNSSNDSQQTCSNCDATSTPLWRRSADDQLLCNACGLYLKLHNTPRPKYLKNVNRNNKDEFITDIHAITHQQQYQKQQQNNDFSSQKDLDKVDDEEETEKEPEQLTICNNCSTTKTPLWRRDESGNPLCNACGLYLKLHNEKRPLSMKTDVIKKRQRTESSDETKKYYEKSSLPGTGVLVMSTHNSVV